MVSELRAKLFKYLDVIYIALAIIWSAGLSIYVVKLALSPVFFDQVRSHGQMFIDFIKYYVLGMIIWAQQQSVIYDSSVQLDFYNRLIEPAHVNSVSYSQYPPYFLVFLAALPILPLNWSYLLWNFGGLVLSIMGLKAIWRQTNTSTVTFVTIVCSMVASLSGFRTMCLGQTSWLYLAIVCMWCWSILRKKPLLEGIALALSTIKFQYSLFFFIPALVAGRKTTLKSFILAELALLLVSGLTLGWSNVFGYGEVLHAAESNSSSNGVFSQEMVNLRGLLSNVMPVMPAFYLSAAVMIVVLCASFVKARRNSQADQFDSRWLISLMVVSALCFSPHTHLYEWVLLAVPAVLTLAPSSLSAIFEVSSPVKKAWLSLMRLYPLIGWFVFLVPELAISTKMVVIFLYGFGLFLIAWRMSNKPNLS